MQRFAAKAYLSRPAATAFYQRRLHGDAHAAAAHATGLWGAYLRANAQRPLLTAFATSATLWAVGDTVAQRLEPSEDPKQSTNSNSPKPNHEHEHPPHAGTNWTRLAATVAEGSFVGGVCGLYWYAFLDRLVGTTLGLAGGTAAFVSAKLALECFIWHPVSLTSFWTFLGLCEGHTTAEIKKELRTDFVPTLMSEYVLWLPIDALNFWLVPVHLQVLMVNVGCLLEAVLLSYVHAHGFPGFGEPAADLRAEKSSAFVDRKSVFLPSGAARLCYERFMLPKAMADIERQWSKMDPTGTGSVDLERLSAFLEGSPLPGMPDATVNRVAAELLVKHAGTGRGLTREGYKSFVRKLHQTAFRESFLDQVVFALFDTDNSGTIDLQEAKQFARVMLNVSNDAAAEAFFKAADLDRNGILSFDEIQTVLQSLRQRELAAAAR